MRGQSVSDPGTVAQAEALLAAEVAECPQCQKYKDEFAPPHTKAFVSTGPDGVRRLYTGGCESGSRRYDVFTHEFVGISHCTCDDGCF